MLRLKLSLPFRLIAALFMALFFLMVATGKVKADTPFQCSSSISTISPKSGEYYTVNFTLSNHIACADTRCFDIKYCKVTQGSTGENCDGPTYSVNSQGGALQRTDRGGKATISTSKSETQPGNWKYWLAVDSFDSAYCTSEYIVTVAPPSGLTSTQKGELFDLCKQVKDSQLFSKCDQCFQKGGTWTAIGCINTSDNGENVIATIVKIGLSIAGGAGLLMIIMAGFTFTTSQGDPKRVGQAREMMSSAIIGLIFVVFSVTLLQFVGTTLLHIPGFGK